MKVNIVSIGNSKGLRIPKSALDQCNFHKEADFEVENNKRQFNNELQHLGQQECTQEDLVSKLVNDIKV